MNREWCKPDLIPESSSWWKGVWPLKSECVSSDELRKVFVKEWIRNISLLVELSLLRFIGMVGKKGKRKKESWLNWMKWKFSSADPWINHKRYVSASQSEIQKMKITSIRSRIFRKLKLCWGREELMKLWMHSSYLQKIELIHYIND